MNSPSAAKGVYAASKPYATKPRSYASDQLQNLSVLQLAQLGN